MLKILKELRILFGTSINDIPRLVGGAATNVECTNILSIRISPSISQALKIIRLMISRMPLNA